MAPARLSALAAVGFGATLAAVTPRAQGAGIALLIGWTGVGLLAIGLMLGVRGSVTAAAVAFILRVAVVAVMPGPLTPPLWAQTLLMVLMVESASASFAFRTRPADPIHLVGRGVAAGVGAMAVTQLMVLVSQGAETAGVAVRVIGVVALVTVAGWVTLTWRRSGLSGG